MCREVRATYSEVSDKEENESIPLSAWQGQTTQQPVHDGMDCSSSSPLQSRFSTLQLPTLARWRMYSEKANLRTTTSWNTEHSVCVHISEAWARSFRRPTYSVCHKCGKCVLKIKKNLGKNNLTFVKDALMIYINFIITVITVPDKKNWRHYFRTAPRVTQLSSNRQTVYQETPLSPQHVAPTPLRLLHHARLHGTSQGHHFR
jgi:hypothetical protein